LLIFKITILLLCNKDYHMMLCSTTC